MTTEGGAKPTAPTTQDGVAPPAAVETDWVGAANRVRSVSDWIVKAFLGIATLLIGTGPLLATIGNIHADLRGLLAGTAAVIALLGVGAVIWMASDINLTRVTDISELTQPTPTNSTARLLARIQSSLTASTMYFAGETSLSGLLAMREQEVAALAEQSGSLARQTDAKNASEIKGYIAQSRLTIAGYDRAIRNLQGWAGYEFVRARFDQLRPWIFASAACTAIGVAGWLFIVGAGAADSGKPAGPKESTVATSVGPAGVLTWAKAGEYASAAQQLRQQMGFSGAQCDAMNVVVEGGTGNEADPWQVATLPGQPCPELRFSIDRRLATFAGFDPSDAKQVTVTIAPSRSGLGWPLTALAGFAFGLLAMFAGQRLLSRRARCLPNRVMGDERE